MSAISFAIIIFSPYVKKCKKEKKTELFGKDYEMETLNKKKVTGEIGSVSEQVEKKNDDHVEDTYAEKVLLLVINFFITFVLWGILPGLQSYSTLPYGI